jgi:hypothetical protein
LIQVVESQVVAKKVKIRGIRIKRFETRISRMDTEDAKAFFNRRGRGGSRRESENGANRRNPRIQTVIGRSLWPFNKNRSHPSETPLETMGSARASRASDQASWPGTTRAFARSNRRRRATARRTRASTAAREARALPIPSRPRFFLNRHNLSQQSSFQMKSRCLVAGKTRPDSNSMATVKDDRSGFQF